jgi:hypothetical protein
LSESTPKTDALIDAQCGITVTRALGEMTDHARQLEESESALLAALKAHDEYEAAKRALNNFIWPLDRMKDDYEERYAAGMVLSDAVHETRDAWRAAKAAALSLAEPEEAAAGES